MTVYVDLVICSNVIVTYIFIKLIEIIFNEKIKILKLIFSLLISTISLGLYFVSSKYIYNIRYFIGIVIGFVAFFKKDYKTLIIQIIMFYLLNISFIGTLVIFNINNTIMLYISLLFVTILWIIENCKNIIIKEKKFEFYVKLEKRTLKGFFDTGNNVTYEGIPVVFIKEKYFTNSFKYKDQILISTINNTSLVNIYSGPLLQYKNRKHFVYYTFIKSLDKDIILNMELGD